MSKIEVLIREAVILDSANGSRRSSATDVLNVAVYTICHFHHSCITLIPPKLGVPVYRCLQHLDYRATARRCLMLPTIYDLSLSSADGTTDSHVAISELHSRHEKIIPINPFVQLKRRIHGSYFVVF